MVLLMKLVIQTKIEVVPVVAISALSRLSSRLWAEAMGQVTPCPYGLRLFGNALSHHSPRALILCPLRRLSCLPGTQPATMS